jgi:hypothetical protein
MKSQQRSKNNGVRVGLTVSNPVSPHEVAVLVSERADGGMHLFIIGKARRTPRKYWPVSLLTNKKGSFSTIGLNLGPKTAALLIEAVGEYRHQRAK